LTQRERLGLPDALNFGMSVFSRQLSIIAPSLKSRFVLVICMAPLTN